MSIGGTYGSGLGGGSPLLPHRRTSDAHQTQDLLCPTNTSAPRNQTAEAQPAGTVRWVTHGRNPFEPAVRPQLGLSGPEMLHQQCRRPRRRRAADNGVPGSVVVHEHQRPAAPQMPAPELLGHHDGKELGLPHQLAPSATLLESRRAPPEQTEPTRRRRCARRRVARSFGTRLPAFWSASGSQCRPRSGPPGRKITHGRGLTPLDSCGPVFSLLLPLLCC